MAEAAAPKPASPRTHLYGGQAVVEGVMMRGAGFWAIAVRRPDASIHVESHEIDSIVLKVYPVVAGAGIPLFTADFSPTSFRLTGTRTLEGGTVVLSYDR